MRALLHISGHGRATQMVLFIAALLIPALLLGATASGLTSGCGAEETEVTTTSATVSTTTTLPVTTTALTGQMAAPVPSRADIAGLKDDANAFAKGFYGRYGDAEAMFSQFADDATFWDPSNGDFLVSGRSLILQLWNGLFSYFPDITAETRATYVSADGAAFEVAERNIWPPPVMGPAPEPADHPPVLWAPIVHFKNGMVGSYDMWEAALTLEMIQLATFAPGQTGPAQLKKIIDRYVAAWSSGDEERIAALYRTDAVFVDSLRGLQAQGPAAIAQLAKERFVPGPNKTLEVVDVYLQTNGYRQPTEIAPDAGAVIAVSIHYRWRATIDGTETPLDGLTSFELGTRRSDSFDLDPNGLIVREEFFYDPDTLVALNDDQWLRFVNLGSASR